MHAVLFSVFNVRSYKYSGTIHIYDIWDTSSMRRTLFSLTTLMQMFIIASDTREKLPENDN